MTGWLEKGRKSLLLYSVHRIDHRCSSHEDDLDYDPVLSREPVQSISQMYRNFREFFQLSNDSGELKLSYPESWQTRKDIVGIAHARQQKVVDKSHSSVK